MHDCPVIAIPDLRITLCPMSLSLDRAVVPYTSVYMSLSLRHGLVRVPVSVQISRFLRWHPTLESVGGRNPAPFSHRCVRPLYPVFNIAAAVRGQPKCGWSSTWCRISGNGPPGHAGRCAGAILKGGRRGTSGHMSTSGAGFLPPTVLRATVFIT